MFCPACGQQQEPAATQCTSCGSPLRPTPNQPDLGKEFGLLIPLRVEPCALIGGYVALFGIAFWILGPVAVILGLIGRARIKKDDKARGTGRVWTAIILGSIETAFLLFLVYSFIARP